MRGKPCPDLPLVLQHFSLQCVTNPRALPFSSGYQHLAGAFKLRFDFAENLLISVFIERQ